MHVVATAIVLLGLVVGCFASVAAQDDRETFIAGAQRQFATSDIPESGIIFLQFTVHVMPSRSVAEEEFPAAVARMREYFTTMVDAPTEMRPVSIDPIGDEARAFAIDTTVEDIPVSLVVIAWREGRLVYTAASAAISGDQIAELKPILARLENRQYEDSPVRTDPTTGMRTGGAWDLLPNLQDIPEGFALQREVPLEPASVGTPVP